MKTITKIILLVAVAILLLNNCKKDDSTTSNSNSIIGKWGITHINQNNYNNGVLTNSYNQDIKTTDTTYFLVDFNTNNTFNVSYPNSVSHAAENGTYTVSANNLTLVENGITNKTTFTISNNVFTLSAIDTSATYRTEIKEVFARK